MCITTEQAKSLAVRYRMFADIDFHDYDSVSLWGGMLLEAQLETGVELYPESDLRRWIEHAEYMIERNRQLAA